ncbi:MAG: hypothetical protein ACKVOW_13210 [Chitinophagaceae bacterium]
MKKNIAYLIIVAFIISSNGCTKKVNDDNIIIVAATGDISSRVNDFRNMLGLPLNTLPGSINGRREINWDGVPSEFVNQSLPVDFFNPTTTDAPQARQRGLIYSSVTGEFRVSNNGFANVNQGAATEFTTFSGDKVFANISNNLWDAGFQVAGQAVAATVKGFGIVFSDVDLGNTNSLEFFNENKSLGVYFVPAKTTGSNFSFLGVYFKNERVTRVRVKHDGKLSDGQNDISNGGTKDLVVMDDFLYDEPVKR